MSWRWGRAIITPLQYTSRTQTHSLTLLNLPTDVVLLVIDELRHNCDSLSSLALTCRSLRPFAVKALYTHPTVRTYHNAMQLLSLLLRNSYRAGLVTRLSIVHDRIDSRHVWHVESALPTLPSPMLPNCSDLTMGPLWAGVANTLFHSPLEAILHQVSRCPNLDALYLLRLQEKQPYQNWTRVLHVARVALDEQSFIELSRCSNIHRCLPSASFELYVRDLLSLPKILAIVDKNNKPSARTLGPRVHCLALCKGRHEMDSADHNLLELQTAFENL